MSGRPAQLLSGDRLILATEKGRHYRVRLIGVQTLPPDQARGADAKRYLGTLVMGRFLTLKYLFRDSAGYLVGNLLHGGADVNIRLIQAGLARHDPQRQPVPQSRRYAEAEQRAKLAKQGIWNPRDRGELGKKMPAGPALRFR